MRRSIFTDPDVGIPEPPLRRLLLTVLPDGTPVETLELRREETVASER